MLQINTILTNITNTTSMKFVSTVSINSDDKKVKHKMDCYTVCMFLLVIVIYHIIIHNHYTKY